MNLARPDLGERPIAEIAAPEVLRVLKAVEARGRLETAKRLRATIGQVFRFAVATGRGDVDPTASLRGAIASPVVLAPCGHRRAQSLRRLAPRHCQLRGSAGNEGCSGIVGFDVRASGRDSRRGME